MKRFVIFFSALLLLTVSTSAQVAINHDHSQADATAVLDVKSTIRGVLFPRMTRSQMSDMANNSLPEGLMAFNTDDGKLYIYAPSYNVSDNTWTNVWKEVSYETGNTLYGKATYTIGSGGSCSQTQVNGYYAAGAALDGSNTVTLEANVTVAGTWSITTNTVNDYHFSGSGTFTTTGTQTVTLSGKGTPHTGQTDAFTATASNGGGTCSFKVIVMGTVTSQGQIWLDRNLGASRVAKAKDDDQAYGDYFQWGRAAEGHEKSNSGVYDGDNNGLATTALPNQGHHWDGKFISTSNGRKDWLSSKDNTLWQGVNGTNNPCPSGFRIPSKSEWNTEYTNWVQNNADGAYKSPLKLTMAGDREYSDGSMDGQGNQGWYWASTVNGDNADELGFTDSSAQMDDDVRAYGESVRCIKDQ